MSGSFNAFSIILLTLLFSAALSDLRERRIPNELIVLGLALGFALTIFRTDPGFIESLLGAILGLSLFLPFFLLRWVGGGDVKLLSVVGAHIGHTAFPQAIAFVIAIGGLVAIVVLYYNRVFQARHQLPYAVPIFLGVACDMAIESL